MNPVISTAVRRAPDRRPLRSVLRLGLGLTALCALARPALLSATTYYVDPAGSDGNNGTSSATPWKTLAKVNGVTFAAGDQILFKAGGVWGGQLAPLGSGASGSPITINLYGSGSKPVINGPGTNGSATLSLQNVAYWEVDNLEITNTQPSGGTNQLTGIYVNNSGTTVLNHIYIQNCYVHDVNSVGTPNSNYNKDTGGIIFDGDYAYVLVANCDIANVTVEGLRTSGSTNANNIVFMDNLLQNIYGDGIVIHGTSGGSRIENNVIYNACMSDAVNFAGCWTYGSNGTIVQQNEVYGLQKGGPNDGEPFDSDESTDGDIFQYNYSHDNNRGFMLIMAGASNLVVRYNISQNDSLGSSSWGGHRLFAQNGAGNASNHIYNNVFYSDVALDHVWVSGGTVSFDNNILDLMAGAAAFNSGSFSSSCAFRNNDFYPGSITAVNGPAGNVSNNMTGDPKFASPDTGGTGIALGSGGFATTQAAYYLRTGSPALGTGLLISGNGGYDYWGNPVSSTAAPNIGAYNGAGTADLSVGTTADSYVRDGAYADTNYGSAVIMTVKSDAAGYNRHAFMTFDTSSAAGVDKAVINLYVSSVGSSASRTVTVYAQPTTTWGESTLTWNNAPAPGTQLGAFNVSNMSGMWYSFDVTSYVQAQRAGGQNVVSFELIDNGAADPNSWVDFATKESATGNPTLVITPGTLDATKDTYVRDGAYADSNYGTAGSLVVKTDATGYNRRSYLAFDTSAVGSATTWTLKLFVGSVGSSSSRTISVYTEPATTWGETTLTWNNAPAAGSLLGTFNVGNVPGSWYTFDVSSYVNAQRANGIKQVSFVLEDNGSPDSNSWVDFNSNDATTGQPELAY